MSTNENYDLNKAKELFGLEQNFTLGDINDIYRRLVKENHPDLASDEKDKLRRSKIMVEINTARFILRRHISVGVYREEKTTTKEKIDWNSRNCTWHDFMFDADYEDLDITNAYIRWMTNEYNSYKSGNHNAYRGQHPSNRNSPYYFTEEELITSNAYDAKFNVTYDLTIEGGNFAPTYFDEFKTEISRVLESMPKDWKDKAHKRAMETPEYTTCGQASYCEYIEGYGFAERHDGLTAMDYFRMIQLYRNLNYLIEDVTNLPETPIFLDLRTGIPFYGTATFKDGYVPIVDSNHKSRNPYETKSKHPVLKIENGGWYDKSKSPQKLQKQIKSDSIERIINYFLTFCFLFVICVLPILLIWSIAFPVLRDISVIFTSLLFS